MLLRNGPRRTDSYYVTPGQIWNPEHADLRQPRASKWKEAVTTFRVGMGAMSTLSNPRARKSALQFAETLC
jgi:hypothetical protein